MAVNMDNNIIIDLDRELLELSYDIDFVKKFQRLQEIMYLTAVLKGWHSPSKSFGEQVVMMHSELSEAIEAYRTRELDDWFADGKPEGVATELGDTVIRVLDTSELLRKDLLFFIIQKARYNLSRSHRHGGKVL